MIRRIRRQFSATMSPYEMADALNRMAEDLYNLVGGFSAAPPLQVAENVGGVQISMNTAALPQNQFVKITSASAITILLTGNRTVADGVFNGTTTLTSATANFTLADVGKELVSGSNISPGTTISIVNSSTNVTMSAAALTSLSSQTVTIGALYGYQAKLESWSPTLGSWIDGAAVRFYGANSEAPTNGKLYLSKQIGVDVSGVPIWSDNLSVGIAVLNSSGGVVDAICTNLQMDSANVITVANISAGLDQLSVSEAGPSQSGVVNHNLASTQQFAGPKKFQGTVEFGSTTKFDNTSTWIDSAGGANTDNMVFTCNYGDFQMAWTNSSAAQSFLTFNTDTTVTYNGPSFTANTDLCQGQGGQLSLSRTTDYMYIAACSGTPTGVPSQAGNSVFNYRIAIQYDLTNDKIYVYNPSTNLWKPH